MGQDDFRQLLSWLVEIQHQDICASQVLIACRAEIFIAGVLVPNPGDVGRPCLLGVSVDVSPRNGFSGLHWAVEFAHLDTVKLLLARGAPLEVKNVYGGTVLGQAVWSAIHEPR